MKSQDLSQHFLINLERADNMDFREYDYILLKDGRTASVMAIAGDNLLCVDVGDSPEDWDNIFISTDEVEKILKRF